MVVSDDHAGLRKADHRLIRASVSETHENWIEAHRYLDMGLLKEQKKRMLMELAA